MKPLRRKLTLKSQSIANLDGESMKAVVGGNFTVDDPTCGGDSCEPVTCDGQTSVDIACPQTINGTPCLNTIDPLDCYDTIEEPCVHTNPVACPNETASDVICC